MKVNVLPGQINVTPDLASLQARLNEACKKHQRLHQIAKAAISEETAAREEVNAAQQAIDDALSALKKVAPPYSNWSR